MRSSKRVLRFSLKLLYEDKNLFVRQILPFLSLCEIIKKISILDKSIYHFVETEVFSKLVCQYHYLSHFGDKLVDLENQFRMIFLSTRKPYKQLLIFLHKTVDLEKKERIESSIRLFTTFVKKLDGGEFGYNERASSIKMAQNILGLSLIPLKSTYQSKPYTAFDINTQRLYTVSTNGRTIKQVDNMKKFPEYGVYPCCDLKVFYTHREYNESLRSLRGGARTMQTARRSFGGKAPRKQLATKAGMISRKPPNFFNTISLLNENNLNYTRRIYNANVNLIPSKVCFYNCIIEISTLIAISKRLVLRSEKNSLWLYVDPLLAKEEREGINEKLESLRKSPGFMNSKNFQRERISFFPFVDVQKAAI